jgi:hypothetical protein
MLDQPAAQDAQCLQWVAQLIGAMHNAGIVVAHRQQQSITEFTQLRRSVAPALIQEVLNWHCANLRNRYAPQAFSGKTFRLKFAEIQAAMLRDAEKVKTLSISPESQQIADRLIGQGWPGAIVEAMPEIVQVSMDRWAGFVPRVRAMCNRLEPKPVNGRFTGSHEHSFLTIVLEGYFRWNFVEKDWLPAMHERHGWKRDFRDDPLTIAFDPASKAFRHLFWMVWASNHSHQSPTQWNPLLIEILKAPQCVQDRAGATLGS